MDKQKARRIETARENAFDRRAEAIRSIESLVGKDAVVPLDTVAHLLPNLPEWDEYRPRRRRSS